MYRGKHKRVSSRNASASFWKRNQFKIMVFASVVIILVCWWCNENESGTWSTSYTYIPEKRDKRKFVRQSKGEIECRRVMEKLFRRPFPSKRPLFLMNAVTGKPLEIDCCNEDLMLGVEYNGVQHYKYVPGMHRNHDAFRTQQYRDEMKERLCKDNQFELIIVPYTIDVDDIELHLKTKLQHRLKYGFGNSI